MTIQLKMKILGEMAITSQNVLKTADFNSYINSADWENLKQVIIRYDIEFRKILKGEQLPRSNATIEAKVLPRTISYMKSELPENWRILDQLISYL